MEKNGNTSEGGQDILPPKLRLMLIVALLALLATFTRGDIPAGEFQSVIATLTASSEASVGVEKIQAMRVGMESNENASLPSAPTEMPHSIETPAPVERNPIELIQMNMEEVKDSIEIEGFLISQQSATKQQELRLAMMFQVLTHGSHGVETYSQEELAYIFDEFNIEMSQENIIHLVKAWQDGHMDCVQAVQMLRYLNKDLGTHVVAVPGGNGTEMFAFVKSQYDKQIKQMDRKRDDPLPTGFGIDGLPAKVVYMGKFPIQMENLEEDMELYMANDGVGHTVKVLAVDEENGLALIGHANWNVDQSTSEIIPDGEFLSKWYDEKTLRDEILGHFSNESVIGLVPIGK